MLSGCDGLPDVAWVARGSTPGGGVGLSGRRALGLSAGGAAGWGAQGGQGVERGQLGPGRVGASEQGLLEKG